MSSAPLSCPDCRAPLRASDRVCPFCGHILDPAVEPTARPEPSSGAGRPASVPGPEPAPGSDMGAAGPGVETVGSEPPPWERRRQAGLFRALWLTWRDSVFRPVPFFRRLPPRNGFGPAIGYAVVVTAIGLFFSFYWSAVEGALRGVGEGGLGLSLVGGLVTVSFGLAFALPLYVGFLFAVVAVLHVGFMAVGAGRRGYEATFRALAYSSGPVAFAVFPFFGPLLSGVWGMVVTYIAVREVQRTTNARATLGFLVPLLAALAFVLLLGVLFALLLKSLDLGRTV